MAFTYDGLTYLSNAVNELGINTEEATKALHNLSDSMIQLNGHVEIEGYYTKDETDFAIESRYDSLSDKIAYLDYEIDRLRAENANLQAQITNLYQNQRIIELLRPVPEESTDKPNQNSVLENKNQIEYSEDFIKLITFLDKIPEGDKYFLLSGILFKNDIIFKKPSRFLSLSLIFPNNSTNFPFSPNK